MSTVQHSELMVSVERKVPSSEKPQRQYYFPSTLTQALAIWQTEGQKPTTRNVSIYVKASSWSRT